MMPDRRGPRTCFTWEDRATESVAEGPRPRFDELCAGEAANALEFDTYKAHPWGSLPHRFRASSSEVDVLLEFVGDDGSFRWARARVCLLEMCAGDDVGPSTPSVEVMATPEELTGQRLRQQWELTPKGRAEVEK